MTLDEEITAQFRRARDAMDTARPLMKAAKEKHRLDVAVWMAVNDARFEMGQLLALLQRRVDLIDESDLGYDKAVSARDHVAASAGHLDAVHVLFQEMLNREDWAR